MVSKDERYNELFKQFSDKVEAWLIKLIAVSIILLLVVQIVWRIPLIRTLFSRVEKLEGTDMNNFASHLNVWYNIDQLQALPAFLLDYLISL